jgi:hypothetical protein
VFAALTRAARASLRSACRAARLAVDGRVMRAEAPRGAAAALPSLLPRLPRLRHLGVEAEGAADCRAAAAALRLNAALALRSLRLDVRAAGPPAAGDGGCGAPAALAELAAALAACTGLEALRVRVSAPGDACRRVAAAIGQLPLLRELEFRPTATDGCCNEGAWLAGAPYLAAGSACSLQVGDGARDACVSGGRRHAL